MKTKSRRSLPSSLPGRARGIGVWSGIAGWGVLLGVATSAPAGPIAFTRVADTVFPPVTRDVYSGAWGDYDGDGRPDLFLSALEDGPGILLRNLPNGFEQAGGGPMSEDFVSRGGATWGDVDNDGRLDLFVAGAYARQDILYLNLGGGAFRRVLPAGVSAGYGITPIFSDFDRDGWLDVFVANGGGSVAERSFVLRNTGDGTLERSMVGDAATHSEYSHGGAFGDYDGDGDDDLMVMATWNQPNSLFRNDGGGVFTRTTNGVVGTSAAGGGSCAAWGDHDNDGDLDLLTIHSTGRFILHRNEGGQLVRDGLSNLPGPGVEAVGFAWADFDNDGFLDVILARRAGAPRLFRGFGDGQFEEVTDGPLVTHPIRSNGLAIADYDLDGRLDVWISNWGNSGRETALFRNETEGGNFLRVRLHGAWSNRSGIGAKVRVRTVVGGEERWQLRVIGGNDSAGSQELVAHFGLGAATEADEVRIEWPAGGIQQLRGIQANQVLGVEESVPGPLGIVPEGGTFDGPLSVRIFSMIPLAEVRYTLDGTDPTPASARYQGAFTIVSATTVKARLYANGFPVSEVVTAAYTPLPVLRFTPAEGRFTNAVEVALRSSLPGTEIRFTLDGTVPVATSERYAQPLRFTAAATVQARAFLNGFPVSEVVTGRYQRVYAFGGEGIDEAWRIRHFGADYAVDPRAAAAADPDEDGTHNRQEFAVGTDPLDPLSGFRVGVRAIPEIRFVSVPGRVYRVMRSETAAGSPGTVVAELTATGRETVWSDPEAGVVVNPAFYTIQPVP